MPIPQNQSMFECVQLVNLRVSSLNCAMNQIRLSDWFVDYEKQHLGQSNLVKVTFGLR